MSNKKTKIYVVTHKKYDNIAENDVYTPLFVGAKDKESYGYLRDDTGDNISEKNQYYSELTGLYWMWKNSDADIVGLNHYRRLLVNGFLGTGDLLKKEQIERDLEENAVIVSKRKKEIESVYDNFLLYVSKEDFLISCELFEEFYPEYKETFYKVLYGNDLFSYSIFVAYKDWFDSYCSWLFPYLFELEKKIYESNNLEQKRVIGYIAEILLDVYIKHNEFKAKEYYLRLLEAKSNVLGNLINDSYTLSYIYYYTFLNKKI
ncbi:MAG: DUF4422 domain-containing protein [Methanobrevibacter sp.]|uniref:DUF4422 domain-containing protein n=1 Tax=Methanobrevibacter sp. TaxID=66852 RepID=UPI0025D3E87B|nr:DUF4422 domain-containing protein [Methanobrevibacter sp.]MBQ6138742.1 DUF4422 domain-containing protein [Methanobrevibacter sp.]